MKEKGKYVGMVSVVNKWGTGFKLEGKDSWLNLSKSYKDCPKFTKGDMVEFQYEHNPESDKTYVISLKILAEREPIEVKVPTIGAPTPLLINPVIVSSLDSKYDTGKPFDTIYVPPYNPYVYKDKELIPSEVALEKAIILFADKLETPDFKFILYVAAEFEKWIWDFNQRRAQWTKPMEPAPINEAPYQDPPVPENIPDDTPPPLWDDIPPLTDDEDLPF